MSFEKSLSIEAEISKEVNEETRILALKVYRNLIFATPVDEGRARGNWQLSVGAPINTEVDVLDKAGNLILRSGQATINAAAMVQYPVFWITNNLPYINRLNHGHSQQAPKFFVETAIKRANK